MHSDDQSRDSLQNTAVGEDVHPSAADDGSAYPPPPRPPASFGTVMAGLLSPAGLGPAARAQGGDTPVSTALPRAEALPPVLPPGCEFIEEVGRGGMGVVYKARQAGLNRFVAVKMIRAGSLASPEEHARFQAEARAVGRLCHPNIVAVHDVGTAGGNAYVILEFAERNLAQTLAAGPLAPVHAAQLTETLARAVHHAHERGIIHRDLKPANILLRGESKDSSSLIPKIADFGLAKLLSDGAAQTQTGAILGTPSYMAPEQARGRQRDVGPAADVYALGAILYEMLTGRPPFCGATPLDTLEQVRTAEPVPLRQLQPRVPRDLETICLTCLHKDPRKRYGTGEALAEDIRRFLAGEPIQARPVRFWQRGVKWARRRPVAAALTGCGLVAAAALLVVGLTYHFELESALDATKRQRDRAENYYGKMLEAVDSLLTEVGDKDLADIPEMEEARTRLYEKALHFHEALLQHEGTTDPTLRLQQARLLYRIAWLNQWGGRTEHAESYALRSLELCKRLVEEDPDNVSRRRELARAAGVLGALYFTLDRKAEAESARRQAMKTWETLPLDQAADRIALAATCTELGLRCSDDRPEEAGALFKRATALLQSSMAESEVSSVMTQVCLGEGVLHQKHGRVADAQAAYRKGLVSATEAVRHARWVGFNHFNLAQIQHNLGALRIENDPKEAEELYHKSIELCQQLTRRHPRVPLYAKELVMDHDSLAHLYMRTGNAAKAESHLREAIAIHLSGAGRPLLTPVMRAQDLNALSICCAQAQRLADAEAELLKAVPALEPLAGNSSPDRLACLTLAKTMFLLGFVRQQRADPNGARKSYERSLGLLERMQKTAPLDPPDIAILQAAQEGRAALVSPSSGGVKK